LTGVNSLISDDLYLTIMQPHLEYACEIWNPYLAKVVKWLRAFKVCKQGVLKAVVQKHQVSGHACSFEYAILGNPQETEETVHITKGSN